MRWLLFCVATAGVSAQTFEATPNPIPQGDTLRIHGGGSAVQARLDTRTIRLFPQKEGGSLGLMPISVMTKPGEYKLELLGKDGATVQTIDIIVRDARFTVQNVALTKALTELKSTREDVELTKAFRNELLEMRYWEEPLSVPTNGCLTSLFGVRRKHNGKLTGDYHGGLDQRGKEGEPVRAIAAGVVKIARPLQLQGGTVGIDHGQGLESMYMHMSKVAATEGATVQKGDVIGYVGSTGRSTAPHLHWSLYANGVSVNPRQWVQLSSCYQATKRAPRKRRSAATQH
jgi:murein DD-endopeptidase MepM/ murein hydrolase activator NlpD